MSRIAIYTVLVGAYDNVVDPLVVNNEIDYICFVGKGEAGLHNSKVWKFIEIEDALKDKGRMSRIPKILPHKTALSEYDYSLYVDANILIKEKYIYDRIGELVSTNTRIALLQHPFRDCVYQEAYVCIASLKGGWSSILRQIAFLKRKRYPKHAGLYEANVIFRKHNELEVVEMDKLWWKTFMRYSKRDQLSLVYALKETKLQPVFFLPPGQTTRNHPAFEKIMHLAKKGTHSQRMKKTIVKVLSGVSRKLLKE